MKENVTLREDSTENSYAGTSLLEDRWQGFANSQELSLPCFWCNRKIPNPRPGSRARFQASAVLEEAGGAEFLPQVGFLSPFWTAWQKHFSDIWKLARIKDSSRGLRALGAVEGWVWLAHAGHFPGASPLLAGAPALAVYGISPHNGRMTLWPTDILNFIWDQLSFWFSHLIFEFS